jgi:hypothetical protein
LFCNIQLNSAITILNIDRRCAPNPVERWSAQECLTHLSAIPVVSVTSVPAVDASFDCVCKFINKFCASGHHRGTAEVTSAPQNPEISVSFTFEKPIKAVYENLRPKESWPERLFRFPEWLLVRKDIGPRAIPSALTYQECLTPDFYVLPLQSHVLGNVCPRAIFLPRNLFCFGIVVQPQFPGLLDVANLTLLFQSEWFTVFRYQFSATESWIIKLGPFYRVTMRFAIACTDMSLSCSCCYFRHTSLNSSTFKYLLQEKAMCV